MWWLGLAAVAVLIVVLLLVLLWWLQGLRRQTALALGPDAMRLQAQLLQGMQALDLRLQQLERSSQSTQMTVAKSDGALDRVTQHVQTQLAQALQGAQLARSEQVAALTTFREEVAQLVQRLTADSQQARSALAQSSAEQAAHVQQRFEALAETTRGTLDSLKGDIQQQLTHMSTHMGAALKDQLGSNGEQLRHQFAVLQDAVSQQLGTLAQGQQTTAEQLRGTLNERLATIQNDNAVKLDEMRRTVDEKLHATLEKRLGESFKLVSDRLEQVHKGLGEMQTLAGSVGDLKRVMTNVKSRGTWGELQLGSIIDNVLTPEQYAKNVKTVPGSDELVEFAIRMPGRQEEQPVWLPIDAKYPVEHYQRLQDAQDSADRAAIAAAGNAFESSIRAEARKIAGKYIAPPYTTDFAVMYLPTEGLFAEVLRRPGLVEALQNESRIVVTGPANLAAMLNSLQMGFKTLAIEKRSSEVWGVLGQVKTEFGKFGEVVEATRKSIDAAARKFDQVGVRTRAIQRHLRNVQELPANAEVEQPLFPATPLSSDQISAEDEE
ncbi:DNA recombination protein RmuC [Comamonas fluminis]|uniref:DNA recombination protein RmuC n=1 Tax=Comamonas fluminis TaxID=2796366 RepID=UPI001C47F58D|nr:DNA recombination protein RmuC [Comamonas fluminis]